MATLTLAKSNPVIIEILAKNVRKDLTVTNSTALTFKTDEGQLIRNVNSIVKKMIEYSDETTYNQSDQVNAWIDLVYPENPKMIAKIDEIISKVENALNHNNYISGISLGWSDIVILSYLEKSRQFLTFKCDNSLLYKWISESLAYPSLKDYSFPNLKSIFEKSICSYEQGGRFMDLPNATKGAVVVRFPPEASGYLHIGHAKAALLNQFYKNKYDGKLILRFDDTNPAKEKESFENIILEDVKLLQLTPDIYSRTSDYFDKILEYAENLIRLGFAYCDNTPTEEMRNLRNLKQPSKFRDTDVTVNLQKWNQMRTGIVHDFVLRAKIDFSSDNGCMRDPTLYRYVSESHPTCGNKYCIYPTYDFACPIVDSIEGVTHALRTSEYHDRDEQYYWVLDKLNLRKPIIVEYSRFNLRNTVLSKRKLSKLVDSGIVEGWDDPRMPTVRGFLRHGLTLNCLKEFIIAQGFSKSVVTMKTDKLWAFNRKSLEASSPRLTALIGEIASAEVNGDINQKIKEIPLFPKQSTSPTRPIHYTNLIFIEKSDYMNLKLNQVVTLLNWGNAKVTYLHSGHAIFRLLPTNTDFSSTYKISWLSPRASSPESMINIDTISYGNLLTKEIITAEDDFEKYINADSKKMGTAIGESCFTTLKKGDIIQIMRRGFFICDREHSSESPLVLIELPSGVDEGDPNKNNSKKSSTINIPNDQNTNSCISEKNTKVKVENKGSKQSEQRDNKKKTKLGLNVKKSEDFSLWYSQVLVKSEMMDYYDVSGCYVIRPLAFSIWETIQHFIDTEIKKLGVKNCYFPMFVSESALKKEQAHIADFAPEVAWVTRSGDTDLAEPIAIRPTSETVMYPLFSNWIQSHRDLPMKLNQWCNVVRWEFKHPTPFLRTREFLWQEGHSVFANKAEAVTEVFQILDIYARVYTDLLAIPVVKGIKSEAEKFAGSEFSSTVETYIPTSGRGLQGATSHHLGQNFSKMFNIGFEDPATNDRTFAYQNSWGLSTRTIGALVMIHGDDQGLVLPPAVSPIQTVIVPCGITAQTTEEQRSLLMEYSLKVKFLLEEANLRAYVDDRDYVTPGWKFNHWELKGVPLRLEIGPRDLQEMQVSAVKRYDGERFTIPQNGIGESVSKILSQIQKNMFENANSRMNSNKAICYNWCDFMDLLSDNKIILAPFCGEKRCEEIIRKESMSNMDESDGKGGIRSVVLMGAKSLCIPANQPESNGERLSCIRTSCQNKAQKFALFGKSY